MHSGGHVRAVEPKEALQLAAALIMGADSSVDVLANLGFGFAHTLTELTVDEIFSIADERLQLRAVLHLGPKPPNVERYKEHLNLGRLEELASLGWMVRFSTQPASSHVLLVDRGIALVSRDGPALFDGSLQLADDADSIRRLRTLFDNEWASASPLEALYSPSKPLQPSLVVAVGEQWNQLIALLARQPELMYDLPPRRFEELTAEILTREGLQVTLTPQSRDGGRDILAFAQTSAGRHLYYVECKRFSATRPVDVAIVRNLYGVVEADHATAGLVVTTSRFTPDAVAFRDTVSWRMALKDYRDVVEWLRRYAGTGI